MTAIAVLCWFAWLGLLPQTGWSFWFASPVCVLIFTLAALGEYYADTLPITPNRMDPPLLLARCVFGALVGALAAHSIHEPLVGGILFVLAGVFAGAFGGIRLRAWAARRFGRDLPAALTESALALAIAVCGSYLLHGFLNVFS
ncbi:DUF4126 domain-containing protein [Granulicella sp. 5B5]|nr:DUF4126 domain-containing protein [Granulicella sp. 5B5]